MDGWVFFDGCQVMFEVGFLNLHTVGRKIDHS